MIALRVTFMSDELSRLQRIKNSMSCGNSSSWGVWSALEAWTGSGICASSCISAVSFGSRSVRLLTRKVNKHCRWLLENSIIFDEIRKLCTTVGNHKPIRRTSRTSVTHWVRLDWALWWVFVYSTFRTKTDKRIGRRQLEVSSKFSKWKVPWEPFLILSK